MIAHDKKPYYDRQLEPFFDPEWEEAERADESAKYYWVPNRYGGKVIKKYKPSVAALVSKRTGLQIIPLESEE